MTKPQFITSLLSVKPYLLIKMEPKDIQNKIKIKKMELSGNPDPKSKEKIQKQINILNTELRLAQMKKNI